jgi:hypothetical protein
MSQNIEEKRQQWPKKEDNFTVASDTVDSKKVWQPASDYPKGGKYHKVRATTFRSGQSFEVDETPGAERFRLINTDGSYIEMQGDGTRVMRAEGSTHEVVVKDRNVRVKGTENVHISGAQNVKIEGNAKLEIGGNFDATVGGLTKFNFKGGTELNTPFLRISGNEVSHDGINIGKDHVHRDVEPGAGTSGIPLPI